MIEGRITRRQILRSGGTALALSLVRLGWRVAPPSAEAEAAPLPPAWSDYRGWEDLYRQPWTWDRIAKGSHFVNCWYQRGCNWDVYVKDGIVFREEQAATYPRTNTDVPDFNPRGCQKGACYGERMYDAARLRYPLKRVGPRGAGRWQRISWEQALREIADRTIDVLVSDGPAAVVWDQGTAQTSGAAGLGAMRTSLVLDTPVLDVNAEIGDHHPGAQATCGKISFSSSADDLFYSDLILIWGGNPTYTQIPNAHFINEARYRGAHVVTIAPDYNASAIHADQWVPVEVGTDAALALALAQVIVAEGLYDAAFVKEQTDLALLVRSDTRRFLRQADLMAGGAEDVFYVLDAQSRELRQAPRASLSLEGLDPALDGEIRVRTAAGEVAVTPVFALLHEQLSRYTPERASRITGTPPAMLRDLARRLARARAACCITQSNFSKFYHGLEMERAQILLLALTGQMGRKGAGFMSFPYLSLAGMSGLAVAPGTLAPAQALQELQRLSAPAVKALLDQGLTREMVLYELARNRYAKGSYPSSTLFFYRFGGVAELWGRSKSWDPSLGREVDDYLAEAVAQGWQVVPAVRPRILFEDGGNLLRRIRGYQKLIEHLLPRLDLLVTIDWRLSNTALHSDYVIPAAAWYEKDDITWATPIAPFAQVITRAVEPLAEARTDWAFHCLLVGAIEQRAHERGLDGFRDREGKPRSFAGLYDALTFGRRFTESNPEDFLEQILELTTNLDGIRWRELASRGFARYTELGSAHLNLGNATDIRPGETITACTWHTRDKLPWPTLTRRMQFFIDHPFYVELGEELPVHKDLPPIGGDYPLKLTGGHTRWSIHASWRDHATMLRLNRGEPILLLGREDAAARGIADGDRVRVFNDVDAFEIQAKLSPSLRRGQVIVYHAWEPYQFKDQKSYAAVTPSPINPIQLAGGYFHLQPLPAAGTPGSTDRGTRVEIVLAERRAPAGQAVPAQSGAPPAVPPAAQATSQAAPAQGQPDPRGVEPR